MYVMTTWAFWLGKELVENKCKIITFTNCTGATPGAIVLADTCGRAGEMVSLGTSEMNLMSDEVL